MGKCQCGKEIDDKYKMCLDCLNKTRNNKPSTETLNQNAHPDELLIKIETHLEHINWNLGKISAILSKDTKLFNQIKKDEKENRTPTTG